MHAEACGGLSPRDSPLSMAAFTRALVMILCRAKLPMSSAWVAPDDLHAIAARSIANVQQRAATSPSHETERANVMRTGGVCCAASCVARSQRCENSNFSTPNANQAGVLRDQIWVLISKRHVESRDGKGSGVSSRLKKCAFSGGLIRPRTTALLPLRI